jgi:ribosomal protein S18 acetylase RimI-like enzyme
MVVVDRLRADDPTVISAAFAGIGWSKPIGRYERYLVDQERGDRAILVARDDGQFAGYVVVVWASGYLPFREAGTPEIQDLNVLPQFRRRAIGTRLLDAAEALIATRSDVAGIGVGLSPDYGPAQRMYVRRGYVPDGRGVASGGVAVAPMQSVVVDDDLVLYFTRRLRSSAP